MLGNLWFAGYCFLSRSNASREKGGENATGSPDDLISPFLSAVPLAGSNHS